jgi:hypothetical protein
LIERRAKAVSGAVGINPPVGIDLTISVGIGD